MMKAAGAYNRVEEFLDTAARLDPGAYATRGEVFLRRGNARWHLHDLLGAVEAYRAARAAGLEDAKIVSPLSDVLFETGRYREAYELLNAWFHAEVDNVDARSVLRYIILEEFVEGLGLEVQERRFNAELVQQLQGGDDGTIRQALIASDAFDLGLWSLRADPTSLIGRWALRAFITNAAQAWITTLMLAKLSHPNERLTSILIDGAIEAVELVESAAEMRQHFDTDELSQFLDELVARAMDHEHVAVESRSINFVDESNQIITTLIFDEEGNLLDGARKEPGHTEEP